MIPFRFAQYCFLLVALAGPGIRGDTAGADDPVCDFSRGVIRIPASAHPLERLAASELQGYFYRISGRLLPVEPGLHPPGDSRTVLYVGARRSFSAMDSGGIPPLLPLSSSDGYWLRTVQTPERWVVWLLGEQPVASLHAAYAFLEKLGVGFYLGGDALPGTDVALRVGELDEACSPAFAIRGALPWYNFLNGPTTWNPEDYRTYLDQLGRMKANFVGFHAYEWEPFCAYWEDGKWKGGQPLATSANYGWWSVRTLKTHEFGFSHKCYFDAPEFGARAAVETKNPVQSIRQSRTVLADALDYAHRRGLKTALGFELVDDPTTEQGQRRFEARLRAVLAEYPVLDYLWLWEPEIWALGANPPPASEALWSLYPRYRAHFESLQNEDRIHEAIRVTACMLNAHRLLQALAPEKRLILGGWGGDDWLKFTDFLPGLDRALPRDIIFSVLDDIDPAASPAVSRVYSQLSPDRERWPIVWFESDGGGSRRDQWMPQCNVPPVSRLLSDIRAKKNPGVIGIHWRTGEVEDVAAYTFQYAWNPSLTSDAFRLDYARRGWGSEAAPEMAGILRALDELGPRWTGGSGQLECGPFNWFSDARQLPDPVRLAQLGALRARLVVFRDDLKNQGRWTSLARSERLLRTMDWATAYDRAALAMREVHRKAEEAELLRREGRRQEAAAQASEAWKQFHSVPLAQALDARARLLDTRGDWGVLATIHLKAYATYEKLRKQLADLAGESGSKADFVSDSPKQPPPLDAEHNLRLVHPLMETLLPAGSPFTLRVIVSGMDAPATVTLHYRAPGDDHFHSQPFRRGHGTSFQTVLSGDAITTRGVDYYIEVVTTTGRRAASPPEAPALRHFASVLDPPSRPSPAIRPPLPPPSPVKTLRATVAGFRQIHIRWDDSPSSAAIVRYELLRSSGLDFKPAAEDIPIRWITSEYRDFSPPEASALTYGVRSVDVLGRKSPWATVRLRTIRYPAPDAVGAVRAQSGANVIRLQWTPLPAPGMTYEVQRRESTATDFFPIGRTERCSFLDSRAAADCLYSYRVRAIGLGGVAGEYSDAIAVSPRTPRAEPIFSVRFEGNLSSDQGRSGTATGSVEFVPGIQGQAVRLGPESWVDYAEEPDWKTLRELTLSVWVFVDRFSPMPVVACAGDRMSALSYLQLIGGEPHSSIGMGYIVHSGRVKENQWAHLAVTFDLDCMRLYLNGEEAASMPIGSLERPPWEGNLVLGQFLERNPFYQFLGCIDELHLWDRALSAEEIRGAATARAQTPSVRTELPGH